MKRTATVILLTLLLTVIAVTAHKKQVKSVSTTTIEGVVKTIEVETIEITETTTTEVETETTTETTTKTETTEITTVTYSGEISPAQFRRAGVIYAGGYKYTWYSEKVLPGGGLRIPGRHSDGNYVRDENEYLVLASSDLPRGTVVETPFGTGKVYDTGCPSGVIDVYVSWG